ncbi:hypothetical protein [Salipiger sp. CCB-MM3]|uniref:hypothetical protein n=1 Tax=Salipiger sp. CCB-MM3 TaxID=1792508 RepID=UPI000824A3B8|nr:hypothetical protein [Salipiger sp. CCB-MM3]
MNFAIVSAYCANTFRRLRDEEDGLALTEYLLLLGLLVGGVILAVGFFGSALSDGWTQWADWATVEISNPWNGDNAGAAAAAYGAADDGAGG